MRKLLAVTASAIALLAGCKVGPNYVKPNTPLAPAFKEGDGWKTATPSDALSKGKWWELYGDSQLNALEDQVDSANQDIQRAEANFRAARAQIGVNRAAQAPSISIDPNPGAERLSDKRPYAAASTIGGNGTGNMSLPIDLNYEIDLWGRIRRTVTAARENAQATAADLENARLSIHAELALDYFNLRAADAQKKLLDETVAAYKDALQLTIDRADGGVAPQSDVAQARTQLQAALVQDTDVTIQRQQYEHAIAVLVGKPPVELTIVATPLTIATPSLPGVPAVLPSELLERRPDIAAMERRMAASNEQIGIAQAAFYPSLNLAASFGVQGTSVPSWFTWPSRFWAVSPQISQFVFDAGRRKSARAITVAQYDANVAAYRQSALDAFQQVEDNLVAQKMLETEASQQKEATRSAMEALDLFQTRYQGGVDTYLQVITSQTVALQNQRNDIDILRRRLDASVLLMKAVGGGWTSAQLPKL